MKIYLGTYSYSVQYGSKTCSDGSDLSIAPTPDPFGHVYMKTGDKSGAEAPGPSGFPIGFNQFTNVFISAFMK